MESDNLPPETGRPASSSAGAIASESAEYPTAAQAPGVPPKTGLKDWIFTVPFLAAFGLIFVVFDLVQRIALARSRRAHERSILMANRWLKAALRIMGTGISVEGKERAEGIPAGVPLVVISNHQSLFDIPIIYCVVPHKFPRFIAKIELSRWLPTVSFNLKHGENAIINRSNPRQAVREIARLGQRMNERKFAGVIFPEGTRAKDGKLKAFKKAGLSTLLETVPDAMVVPLAIDGSWKLGAFKCKPVPYGTMVKVAVGEPFLIAGRSTEEVMERCFQFTQGKIAEMRTASL